MNDLWSRIPVRQLGLLSTIASTHFSLIFPMCLKIKGAFRNKVQRREISSGCTTSSESPWRSMSWRELLRVCSHSSHLHSLVAHTAATAEKMGVKFEWLNRAINDIWSCRDQPVLLHKEDQLRSGWRSCRRRPGECNDCWRRFTLRDLSKTFIVA